MTTDRIESAHTRDVIGSVDDPIPAIAKWNSNAELIVSVARLGYLRRDMKT